MKLIEIKWEGPFTLEEISQFSSEIDYGVYQIYGTHNILGSDTLVYIGQAIDRTFSVRLPERSWINWDFAEYKIYIGRLGSSQACTVDEWNNDIDIAERILIDYCQPPFNSQCLNGLSETISNEINVLNFSKRFRLPLVVSSSWRESSYEKKQWKAYSNKMYDDLK